MLWGLFFSFAAVPQMATRKHPHTAILPAWYPHSLAHPTKVILTFWRNLWYIFTVLTSSKTLTSHEVPPFTSRIHLPSCFKWQETCEAPLYAPSVMMFSICSAQSTERCSQAQLQKLILFYFIFHILMTESQQKCIFKLFCLGHFPLSFYFCGVKGSCAYLS